MKRGLMLFLLFLLLAISVLGQSGPDFLEKPKDCIKNCLNIPEPLHECLEVCSIPNDKKLIDLIVRDCKDLCYDKGKRVGECDIICSPREPELDTAFPPDTEVPPDEGGEEATVEWTFEFWAMLGFFAAIGLAFVGWLYHKRTRRKIVTLLETVDETYERFRFQKDLCIIEMEKLKKKLKEEFKNGEVDETNFDFLLDKIEKHIKELKK